MTRTPPHPALCLLRATGNNFRSPPLYPRHRANPKATPVNLQGAISRIAFQQFTRPLAHSSTRNNPGGCPSLESRASSGAGVGTSAAGAAAGAVTGAASCTAAASGGMLRPGSAAESVEAPLCGRGPTPSGHTGRPSSPWPRPPPFRRPAYYRVLSSDSPIPDPSFRAPGDRWRGGRRRSRLRGQLRGSRRMRIQHLFINRYINT